MAVREMFKKLPKRASFYYIRDDKMVDYHPNEETVGAFARTAEGIIAAVCADGSTRPPSYQTCRFCDYADLCEKKEAGE